MKLEIYQIGKETPLTVVECDRWVVDLGNFPDIRMIKGDKVVGQFFANNIAGFKEINEDCKEKEAIKTEKTKCCPWCQDNRGNKYLDFKVVQKGMEESISKRFIEYCPFCGRKLSDDNG